MNESRPNDDPKKIDDFVKIKCYLKGKPKQGPKLGPGNILVAGVQSDDDLSPDEDEEDECNVSDGEEEKSLVNLGN